MEDFIKKIKALEPTERMIGLDNVPYAFGWVDAINSVEKLVKESDSLPCVRLSLISCDEIKKHIGRNCRNPDGSHAMDEQTYYEGAKWYRDEILKKLGNEA